MSPTALEVAAREANNLWDALLILKAAADKRDLAARELKKYRLTVDQALDLMDMSRTEQFLSKTRGTDDLPSAVAEPVRSLLIREMPVEMIARLLGLTETQVEVISDQYREANPNMLTVLTYHEDGKTPAEISRIIGMPRSTVHKLLVQAGEQPHRRTGRPLTDGEALFVASERQGGQTLRQIALANGWTIAQVRGALRRQVDVEEWMLLGCPE